MPEYNQNSRFVIVFHAFSALEEGETLAGYAALMAFGFVFIHPFEGANGRIHRYLFHHVLALFQRRIIKT